MVLAFSPSNNPIAVYVDIYSLPGERQAGSTTSGPPGKPRASKYAGLSGPPDLPATQEGPQAHISTSLSQSDQDCLSMWAATNSEKLPFLRAFSFR